jgi:hypothetical protein
MNHPLRFSLSAIDLAELRQRRLVLLAELEASPAELSRYAPRRWWMRLWPESRTSLERRLLNELVALEDARRERMARHGA